MCLIHCRLVCPREGCYKFRCLCGIKEHIYQVLKKLFKNLFINRGMLSHAVHPPTTEHFYAQWQEREELLSRAPLEILQDDNGQSNDEKKEEVASPMSGEPTCWNHFKTNRAARLKGNAV